jgi:acetyl esterase/lipase
MDRVIVRKDLLYAEPGLAFDLYLPEGLAPTDRRPGVVFVHGDGPPALLANAKDWGQYTSWGRLAAAAGLIGVTFNHRSSVGQTKLEEAASDVEALIAHVRGEAPVLHLEPDRIGVWVCSMGPPVGLRTLLRDRPGFLRCIAVYYGVMDLRPLRRTIPAEVPDEVLWEFSPLGQLVDGQGPLPPMLIARAGLEERPWLNPTIDAFVEQALRVGVELDLLNHPSGMHAFDVLNDDERSADIIVRTLRFLERHLLEDEAGSQG